MADLDAEYLPAVSSEADIDQPAPPPGMEPSDDLGTPAYEAPGASEHVIGSDPEDPVWSFDSVRRWRLMAVRHSARRCCEALAVLHDAAAAFQTSW